MIRYCFALDLKEDDRLIAEYEAYHAAVWPPVLQSIREAGIKELEIYRTGNRLFMIMETADDFSFEAKAASDEANREVQRWEAVMWNYQQALPGSVPGEKWRLMNKIFTL